MRADTTELVSPAGTLTAGLYALEAGADAVYFGLERFSARQAAPNLTMSDVRRLKRQALKHSARIFAALNTVIAEDEIAPVLRWIPELVLSGVDGIIVQDLGLATHIRQAFPEVPLHGSTQLAVHNRLGLETASALGFRRVVLSRELSLEEIAALESVAPEVGREVFVHGALCYGFSGLCLASDLLTGRSGNRGECAQICRSWFEWADDKGYYFSLGDLDAGGLLDGLRAAGVTALKIEGRLKSLAYVFNTTAYYRALLDGDAERAGHFLVKSAMGFSRPRSKGFLAPAKRVRMTQPAYPSHVGVPGATVVAVRGREIEIRALDELSRHDRLFRVPMGPPDQGTTIPIEDLYVNGRKQRRIGKGQTAVLRGVTGVRRNETLMKTLSHDMHLRTLSPERYPEFKHPLVLRMAATAEGIRLGTTVLGKWLSETYPVRIEPSRGDRRLEDVVLGRFEESKDYPFTFSKIEPFDNGPPMASKLFVPPSDIKGMRNAFFDTVDAALRGSTGAPPAVFGEEAFSLPLPPRERIVYPDGFPFVPEGAVSGCDTWPCVDGVTYLSLPPVIFDEEKTLSDLEAGLDALGDRPVAVGVNNIGHISIAERWRCRENIVYYGDYGLYAANRGTLSFLYGRIDRLRGVYLWLEASDSQRAALTAALEALFPTPRPGLRFIDEKALFPLFISRVCFHGFRGRRFCGRKCPGNFDEHLKQNRREFTVKVRNCLTYLFAAPSRAAASPAD